MNKWPLNDNQFSFIDRIKTCLFFLDKSKRWTQGEEVKSFEKEMAEFCDSKYSVFVSSGSTANTLVAMYVKDNIYTPDKNIVVLPSVTWQTSCSPWIREGFTPKFIDVSLNDLSMDLDKLEEYLNSNSNSVAAVFITSLLGFCPNIERLEKLQAKFPSIKFALDNCESNLSKTSKWGGEKNISHFFTSTTSTYFGHQIQSVEGGFIFTSSKEEYQYYLKARNHGMVRGLLGYEDILEDPEKEIFNSKRNHLVDGRFDFCLIGNNFRNTDINAFLGRLDLKRANKYSIHRSKIYNFFETNINKEMYVCPKKYEGNYYIPFCLPVILNSERFGNVPKVKKEILEWCDLNGIETRPIISGNLLRQTAYKKFGSISDYPIAEKLHVDGFYVGLYNGVNEKMILKLTSYLNEIASLNIK